MSIRRLISGTVAARALTLAVATSIIVCCGITPERSATAQEARIEIDKVKITIPDLALRDQDGKPVRFYSDLLKDKVVVLSFFYTSCKYICTMQGEVFSKLQTLLGERSGKSVFLISVTTDPVTDTPEQLKAWGARFGVKPGWTLVTGDKAEMNKLLIKFTGSNAGRNMHEAVTFIGNDRRGVWVGTEGLNAPEELLKMVDTLAKDGADGRGK